MSYAILHMQKLKQPAIKGMQIHNQREKESHTNADIDEARSGLNYDLINPAAIDYNEKIDKMIEDGVTTGKAIRKDAVKVASFLVTSDSEFFKNLPEREERRFFESAVEFFSNEYGEKNLAYAMVHKDEKTPHMHVGFVPITEDGRLSAKDFFGKKQQLVKLQDQFYDHMVKEGFVLDRGVSSDRKHVETAKYKALTFQKMEQDAKEKYEQVRGHIKEIDEKTESIEKIDAKRMLGLVGMKEQDYQSLMDYAKTGVVYQQKAKVLEKELGNAVSEIERLKSNMQQGQDKIRQNYKDVRDNLDAAAEKKAKQKLNQLDLVQKHRDLIEKHKGLIHEYGKLAEDKKQLIQKAIDLNSKNQSYQNENRELKLENGKLKEKLAKINQDLSILADRVTRGLHHQIERIKIRLGISNVDKDKIKFLDEDRKKIIEGTWNKIREPEKKQEKELELER